MADWKYDVVIVGAGPAGITAAIALAKAEIPVLVLEAGVFPGAENWSGAVYFTENLAQPDVLGEEAVRESAFERPVTKRGVHLYNGHSRIGLTYHHPETFRHCYTVLRPTYDRYLAELAQSFGATILPETTATGLLRDATGRIRGVQTSRGAIQAEVVFLAEGDASHLVTKEGYERVKEPARPHFLQGIKEVIEMEPAEIERRFQLPRGEGAAYEIILRNPSLRQRAAQLNMGGFIYTNQSSLSLGLVLPLDNLAREFNGDHNRLMEWFKSLPEIRQFIGNGRATAYGTKIIRGGGYRELPRLIDEGLALGGACTGIGIDFPFPNFTGPATAMGRLFANAVKEIRATGGDYTQLRLEELYERPLRDTHYFQSVAQLEKWPHYIEHTRVFFGRLVDLNCGSLHIASHPDLHAGQKLWQLAKHFRETLPLKSWPEFFRDLLTQRAALGLDRKSNASTQALRHFGTQPPAHPGTVSLTFSVDGQARDFPLFAKLAPALRAASDQLYRNDTTPIATKLAQALRAARRDIPFPAIFPLLLRFMLVILLSPVQWICETFWLLLTRPSPAKFLSSFFQKTRTLIRQRLNLDTVVIAQPIEEKLALIRYFSEKTSHIRVIRPEKFEQRAEITKSSLWHVCPAKVYECHTDDLGQSQVVVNFENCIKCESCWRAAPADVDWTRNHNQRLIFHAPTPANQKLLTLLQRNSGTGCAPVRVGETNGRDAHADVFLRELHTGPRYLDTQRRLWLTSLVAQTGNARALAYAKQNKFFWAEAELRPAAKPPKTAAPPPASLLRLRARMHQLFPRQAIKQLDHGTPLSTEQLNFLRMLAEAAAPPRAVILRELARLDLSLALLVSGAYSAQIAAQPALAEVPWIGLHTARAHGKDFAPTAGGVDLRAIALGATEMLLERCRQHATTRVQFPGLFQDEDAHDGIVKFGAVKQLLSQMEAARYALETQPDVDAAELLRLVTYNAGQVIGGSAYSEDDIFSKYYRDAVCLTHFPAQNSPAQPKPVETELDHELAKLHPAPPPPTPALSHLGTQILTHGYIERPLPTPPAFSYRDALKSAQQYDYGDFLVKPPAPGEWRFTPEMLHADAELHAYHDRLYRYFTERFVNRSGEKYHRLVERLHMVPLEDVRDMVAQGFTRMYIPTELGGEGLLKAQYYILCPLSMRYADPSYALTIMAHSSIGTTPILLGLNQDLPRAKQDLEEFLGNPVFVPNLRSHITNILGMLDSPAVLKVKEAFRALGERVRDDIGKKPMLRAVAAEFLTHFMEAGRAGLRLDLATFRTELQAALTTLDQLRPNAEAVVTELDRRAAAARLYLRWISAGQISAFALTEPSAGSDSGGIQTRAELKRVEVFTNPDGTKYFLLGTERKPLLDAATFDVTQTTSHDVAQIRRETPEPVAQASLLAGDSPSASRDACATTTREFYEYYELNGAKMWITNGHVAGVFCLYARTKEGPTGFLVNRHAEGLVVGRDEEKMGQRGSPTNELSLTGVRVPRENIIGIEGRGQVNALETLNVGRLGLCVSAVAMMAKVVEQTRAFAQERAVDAAGILGEMAAELYATESLAYELIGRSDHHGTKSVRTESAIGKYYASEALHRCLRNAERVFGIEGATQWHELEKHRRDARVLNIYEGTNEVQRFLILRDLVDTVLPKWSGADRHGLKAALQQAVATFGAQVWQNPNFQPTMFKLVEIAGYIKVLDAATWRTEWLRSVTPADSAHRQIAEECCARYTEHATAELQRLQAEFDRDFALLKQGLYPPEIRVAQLALWEAAPGSASVVKPTGHAVVVMNVVPVLSPQPHVADGELRETLFDFDAASWEALARTAGATVITVAPRLATTLLRKALAAGAGQAVLLETTTLPDDIHAVGRLVADQIVLHYLPCDRVLCGDATLAAVLNGNLGGMPVVETVAPGETRPDFTMDDFCAALAKPLAIVPAHQVEAGPAGVSRLVLPQPVATGVTIEPTPAAVARFVREATGVSGGGAAAKFTGTIELAEWTRLPQRDAAVFVGTPEQLAGVGLAAACARDLLLPLHAVILGRLSEAEMRQIAARLPAECVWFVTNANLPGNELLALQRFWKDTLPPAVLAGEWANGLLAEFAKTFPRVQARYGVTAVAKGELFVPVFGGKVQRVYPVAHLREHPLVATFGKDDGDGMKDDSRRVFHVPLAGELPGRMTAAVAAVRRGIADAEFIIDVGYAIRNRENFDAVIVPLQKRLQEIGVKHVTIGGTRKVVEELKLLEATQQIGQTGTAVNPQIILAIGVSGAPQHVDYIGDRATIIAFNQDAAAPLMTLNQRRAQPKVVPIVGDLFETVPAFTAALQAG